MREPESKVAPEAISVPIPDDPAWESSKKFLDEHQRCHPHTEALSDCFRCNWLCFRNISIKRITSLTAQVATLENRNAELKGASAEYAASFDAINTIPCPKCGKRDKVDAGAKHLFECDSCYEIFTPQELVATLEQQLRAMTEDRDLWQGEHNEDCPNKARADELEQQLDAQSFPERFAIWKALGFPEGHQGDLVAAVTALKESHAELTEVLTGIQWQVTNGRLCYFGDHTGYEPQISSAQVERWSDALARARSLSAPTKEQPK